MQTVQHPPLRSFRLDILVGKHPERASVIMAGVENRLSACRIPFTLQSIGNRNVGWYAIRHICIPPTETALRVVRQDPFVRAVTLL